MSKAEVTLRSVMEQAERNGFDMWGAKQWQVRGGAVYFTKSDKQMEKERHELKDAIVGPMPVWSMLSFRDLVYDPYFAAAYFKDATIPAPEPDWHRGGYSLGYYRAGGRDAYEDVIEFIGEPWQYHVQQMALAKDELHYMESYLTEEA